MKIHEYQAKELFRKNGIPVPLGQAAFSIDEATSVAQRIPGPPWLVKAQIHAGGRGKAGGVKKAKAVEEVFELAKAMWGSKLITAQTGQEGRTVHRLLIEQGVEIEREFYLALTVDRTRGRLTAIASPAGGMEIEEVAAKQPDKIFRQEIHPYLGLLDFQAKALAKGLALDKAAELQFVPLLKNLYQLFVQQDCSLVEINPLVRTRQGNLLALDGKITFDDNALFRHPTLQDLRDVSEEDPREHEASKYNLNYISLSGNIGCMVNGAGLAMATMDLIKLCGGAPANFLDVGGGASQDQVREAFRILMSDPQVKGVLVNIFGGIVRCDVIARGILEALKQMSLDRPCVVRLEGTNVKEGMRLLQESHLPVQPAGGMAEAAQKIVQLVKGS